MKKILLASVALTLLAAPAMAADLKAPVYKAPPPVYVFNWTGCYVGGNLGGVSVHKEWIDRTPGDPFAGLSYGSHQADSWLGGLQAGCNYQFAGGWVIGIQGDYDWTDAKGSNVNLLFPIFTNQSRVKSLASFTGKIGYAWDRFLGYVKGGGAWERDDYNSFFTATGIVFDTASETRGGWTVGIGGEYAFTDWLSGFAEYDYYDFRTRTNNFVVVGTGLGIPVDIKETKSVLKFGLNVRFGYGPVVAKY
jgi:outer membrane immunogenic protein